MRLIWTFNLFRQKRQLKIQNSKLNEWIHYSNSPKLLHKNTIKITTNTREKSISIKVFHMQNPEPKKIDNFKVLFCENSYKINFYDKKHEDENFVETEINLK
jgi:hypothetical protein